MASSPAFILYAGLTLIILCSAYVLLGRIHPNLLVIRLPLWIMYLVNLSCQKSGLLPHSRYWHSASSQFHQMIPATKGGAGGECSMHFHNLVGHHVLCQPLEPASSTILNLSMGLIIMMHHTNQLHQGASKYYDLKLYYYCLPFKYK